MYDQNDHPGAVIHSVDQAILSQPWREIQVPAQVLAIPTMLSVSERQLLHYLSLHHFLGIGRIVDGGCFLGGSTAALASGLAARTDGLWERVIATYDLFRVEQYTLAKFGKYFPDRTVGSSFRPVFSTHIAPWARYIEVREGDACDWGWSGEPIEILFLDMVKSWRLNDLVLEQFLPALIPGHSVIVQQDYLWGFAPWIHITMELLSPYVTILDWMPHATVAYILTAPIPKDLLGLRVRESLSPDHQRILMDRAVDRWQGEDRGIVELARVMLIAERGDLADARDELDNVLARYAGATRVEQCAKFVRPHLLDELRSWL